MPTPSEITVRSSRPVVELHETLNGWILCKRVEVAPTADAHETTNPHGFIYWDGARWSPNGAKRFPAREDASDYVEENRAMLEAARS